MNVLDDLKKLEVSIVQRYQELQPALAEVEDLRRVAERLGVDLDRASAKQAKPVKVTRARAGSVAAKSPRGSAVAKSPRKQAKRAAGSSRRTRAGGRREQFLKLVIARPGITVPEIGKELKVDPTGLYRYAKELERSGAITKKGAELHPVAS
jgi:hypothetical protein